MFMCGAILLSTRLFVDKIKSDTRGKMSRPIRTLVWVIKMLDDLG